MSEPSTRPVQAAASGLAALFETMAVIRAAEAALARLFADGEVPGFIHLSTGQEAVATGVGSALRDDDTLATTHRGHGHVLAKGLDLEGFFKEVLGRAGGVCAGRGGSMHVSDMSRGIVGANGIVGAGIPIALGCALAHRTRGSQAVSVALFGDGALAQGVLHESLNMSRLLGLPLLLVCENNGWSEFSPTERQFAGSLASLCGAFGIEHRRVDGNDVLAVHAAALETIAALRAGQGPRVLECLTHRARGHYEGDPQDYRSPQAAAESEALDPLARARTALAAAGMSAQALDELQALAERRVAAAVLAAREDSPADFELACASVYASGGAP